MTIGEVHYDIAYHKIMACHNTTAYTQDDLKTMFDSAMFLLNTLNEINGKTVKAFNHKDEEYELLIHIDDIKFFHNDFMIYAIDHQVLSYIKEYILDSIKKFNDECKNGELLWGIRLGGNGYGTALVCSYESYRWKKYSEIV
jgi:hypothetical protein